MSDKKVCDCGRERLPPPLPGARWDDSKCAGFGETHWRLSCERLAAILTPEVLRLIEAGRALRSADASEESAKAVARAARLSTAVVLAVHLAAGARDEAVEHLEAAALALPFEKPAESNHTAKQQLPKKRGE